MSEWIEIKKEMPPMNVVVNTKILDAHGERNITKLKPQRRTPESRVLWFFPDGSMYVYYEPTHWKPV